MRGWLRHHLQSLAQTLRGFSAAPLAFVLNLLVIGISLALPLGAWTLLQNVQGLVEGLAPQGQVSVFFDTKASPAEVAAARKRLSAIDGVVGVQFVPKDQALARLRQTAGVGDLVDALKRNPLPDALVLTLAGNDAVLADRVSAAARDLPATLQVQSDSAWARRLDSILALGRTLSATLAAALGLALVIVTFNTIRLQIVTRRDEIELCKLLGATDEYVRRPFYYLGVIQGLLGGAIALGIVAAGLVLLEPYAAAVAVQYGANFKLSQISWEDTIAVLAFSATLGWIGAFSSVSAHLHGLEAR